MVKTYVKTSGCSVNISEGEIMKALLKKADFEIVNSAEEAFLIILNICTVKGNEKALKEIRKIKKLYPYKKLIVAGCIPSDMPKEIRKIAPDASLISTHNIKDIVIVAEETINDNPISLLKHKNEIKICLPKIRKNKIIAIVPISSGCLGNCSYCSVKLIKGKLFSYPPKLILKEIKTSLAQGCKEIWLTSQDNGAYGKDIGINLINLLKEILSLKENFFLRIGMMNPEHVKEFLNELIEIYKDERIFKFLHIPVQSGNNEILKLMKRRYSVEDFKNIVNAFREEIPNITISTDIICGFPTETDEQFRDSLNLIKEIKPDVLNISRFKLRKGTEAEKLPQLSGEIIKNRSRMLSSIFEWIAYENNKKFLNWQGKILIDEIGKNNTFIGRNIYYKQVIIKGNFKLGDIVNVKIKAITPYDLRAVPIGK